MEKITILIVDDHSLLRDSWSLVFNNDPMLSVAGACGSVDNAIELAQNIKPNVLTLDINMPGMSGIEAMPFLTKASPQTKILGVSMHTQPAYATQMIKKGAMGYLTKTSSKDETIHAIKEVHAGKKYICREIRDILTDQLINGNNERKTLNILSEREMQIIGFIKKGFSSKEIAEKTFISVKTVEVHRYNILRKLDLRNTAALVNFINCHYAELD